MMSHCMTHRATAMPRPALLPSFALALAVMAAAPTLAAPGNGTGPGGLYKYKWVDKDGNTHIGDSIPPEYAQQSATVLNKHGVEVGHVDAPKTDAQLAADADARVSAARQKQHDSFLLATYTSVKDIEALRDERLDQMHAQQVATQQYVGTLGERLSALQSRAQNFKPYSTRPDAHKMPDDLAEQMVHTLNDIRTQRAALSTSQLNETSVRQQFQSDIDRYKELRAALAAAR